MNCARCGKEIKSLIGTVKQLEGFILCPDCFEKAKKELEVDEDENTERFETKKEN